MAAERPIDPEVRTLLTPPPGTEAFRNYLGTPEEARERQVAQRASQVREPVAHVEDRVVNGPHGEVPIRIYRPEGDGPFGILVYIHGGGWVTGNLESVDPEVRRLVNRANCVAVSVDYHLSPEAKFPVAVEDCYAVLGWVAENGRSLKGDPKRIAIAGFSAGGNLSAVTCLVARDRHGPKIIQQVLQNPVTSWEFDTQSYVENAVNLSMGAHSMEWYRELHFTDQADRKNPYAAPLLAPDLTGLPPALIVTAEFDPLRDEGEAYGARLWEAGVPAVVIRYKGIPHSIFMQTDKTYSSRHAVNLVANTLRVAFEQARTPATANA